MNISVRDVNFNAEQKLVEYAKKKVEKLYQVYDHIVAIEVNLRLENNSEESNKTAEIIVKVPGNDLFAKKTSATFEEATDVSVEAMRKQVTKHKEKVR
jgi:putative sigma-54 modulation protein